MTTPDRATRSTKRKRTDGDEHNERAAAAWSALFKVRKPQGLRTDSWAMAHLVTHYLCWWNRFPEIYVSHKRIAANLGLDRYAVRRALHHAEEAGLIERTNRASRPGRWAGTTYRLLFLEDKHPLNDADPSRSDETPSSRWAADAHGGPRSNMHPGAANAHGLWAANAHSRGRLTPISDSLLRREQNDRHSPTESDDDNDRAGGPNPWSSSSLVAEEERGEGRPGAGAEGLPASVAEGDPGAASWVSSSANGSGRLDGPSRGVDTRQSPLPEAAAESRRPNSYDGPCYVCEEIVYSGEGYLSGKRPVHPGCVKSPAVRAAEERAKDDRRRAAAAAEAEAHVERVAAIVADPTREALESIPLPDVRTVAEMLGHDIPARTRLGEMIDLILGDKKSPPPESPPPSQPRWYPGRTTEAERLAIIAPGEDWVDANVNPQVRPR